jgi:CheY-like chemotaxis protein
MPVRFLIADDYVAHQKLLANIVSFLGGVMRCAANGHEAMRLAQSEAFDVVLMDLHMPGLGGVAAADRLIHGWQSHPHRPRIVAVTADHSPERRALCRAVGMDGFVAKPYEPRTLKVALQQVIVSGHCWSDGPPERTLDMKRFLDTAVRLEFAKWADGMPRALRDVADALENDGPLAWADRVGKLSEDARLRGFLKLERRFQLPAAGAAPSQGWLGGALADLGHCLTASREALCLSREQSLAAA